MSILGNVPIAFDKVWSKLLQEPLLKRAITIRQNGVIAWDDELNRNTTTTIDTQVISVQLKHTHDSVKGSSAQVEAGDLYFLIRCSDITGEINTNDTIICSGQYMDIKSVESLFDIFYRITVVGA